MQASLTTDTHGLTRKFNYRDMGQRIQSIVKNKMKINTKTPLVPPSDGRTENTQRSQRYKKIGNQKTLCSYRH